MSSRTAGVLLIIFGIVTSVLDNNNTFSIISLLIGGAAIAPDKREMKQIYAMFELYKKNRRVPRNVSGIHNRKGSTVRKEKGVAKSA